MVGSKKDSHALQNVRDLCVNTFRQTFLPLSELNLAKSAISFLWPSCVGRPPFRVQAPVPSAGVRMTLTIFVGWFEGGKMVNLVIFLTPPESQHNMHDVSMRERIN